MKTRDEFTALLRAAADPATGAEALMNLNDAATELFDSIDAANTKIETLTADNGKLRDTNMRLFLRVTGDAPKDEPERDIFADVSASIAEKFKD